MTQMLSPKIELLAGYLHGLYCPGCKMLHHIAIDKLSTSGQKWSWNGDVDKPTYSPSIMVQFKWRLEVDVVCHSFVRDGQWQFLGDCTHELAGKTVDVIDIPESEL